MYKDDVGSTEFSKKSIISTKRTDGAHTLDMGKVNETKEEKEEEVEEDDDRDLLPHFDEY